MTTTRFQDTITLITGASRGIGLGIAERIVAEGGSVIITGRKQDSIDAAVAELGPRATGIAGNAGDADHRAEVYDHITKNHGRLDHLVNNTGINPVYGPILEIEPDAARKIMEINVLSSLQWTRGAVEAGLRKSIVNVASVAGLSASPGIGYYGVSKGAVINLTKQLAYELAPKLRVNAVAPAVIKTRFAEALYAENEEAAASVYPLKRLGEVEDVAGVVAFLLSDDAAWVTGQTLSIDGGASLAPLI